MYVLRLLPGARIVANAYGHPAAGRRTIPSARPRGGWHDYSDYKQEARLRTGHELDDQVRSCPMTAKQVLFRSAAREKVPRGAAQLADAVRITLGPKSKSVLIQKKWGAPIVCNDGVTIAKEMELDDPAENLGAQMLRQAAEKTGDAVGDGTSTATILAHP
jgi:TCP-1/cpn60 chaperonin family